MDAHNEVHPGEVLETRSWEIEQIGDGREPVGDASHSRLRIEDIFLGHWWTRNFLIQLYGVNVDRVLRRSQIQLRTFEEDVGASIE